jgi:hypothetical protein
MPAEERLESMFYTQYLLLYLDADGQICLQTSGLIADSFPAILSMKVMDVFREAIDVSKEVCSSNGQCRHRVHFRNNLTNCSYQLNANCQCHLPKQRCPWPKIYPLHHRWLKPLRWHEPWGSKAHGKSCPSGDCLSTYGMAC